MSDYYDELYSTNYDPQVNGNKSMKEVIDDYFDVLGLEASSKNKSVVSVTKHVDDMDEKTDSYGDSKPLRGEDSNELEPITKPDMKSTPSSNQNKGMDISISTCDVEKVDESTKSPTNTFMRTIVKVKKLNLSIDDNTSSLCKVKDINAQIKKYRDYLEAKRLQELCLDEMCKMRSEDVRSTKLKNWYIECDNFRSYEQNTQARIAQFHTDKKNCRLFHIEDSLNLERANAREAIRLVNEKGNRRCPSFQRTNKRSVIDSSDCNSFARSIVRNTLRCRQQLIRAKEDQNKALKNFEFMSSQLESVSNNEQVLGCREKHLTVKTTKQCGEKKRDILAIVNEKKVILENANSHTQNLRKEYDAMLVELDNCCQNLVNMERTYREKLQALKRSRNVLLDRGRNILRKGNEPTPLDGGKKDLDGEIKKTTQILLDINRALSFTQKRWRNLQKLDGRLLRKNRERRKDILIKSYPNTFNEIFECIRNKEDSDRSLLEKKWVGLDFMINEKLYSDKQEIFFNEEYSNHNLNSDDIKRLTNLPSEINIAIPFIRSSDELEAYKIIYHESFTNKVKDSFHVDDQMDKQIYPRIAYTVEEFANDQPQSNGLHSTYLVDENRLCMLSLSKQEISRGDKIVHNVKIPEISNDSICVKLTVLIIFRGIFLPNGLYKPGRLSAILKSRKDQASSSIVGNSPHHLQSLNSKSSLGQIVIVYEPQMGVTKCDYEIVLESRAKSQYSIKVDLVTGKEALQALKIRYQDVAHNVNICEGVSMTLNNLGIWIEIAERRATVLRKLLSEADNSYKRCQDDLNSIAEMVDNTCKEVSNTIYETLPKKTSMIELEIIHWCKINAIRNEDLDKTLTDINDLVKLRQKCIIDKEDMEKKNQIMTKHFQKALLSMLPPYEASKKLSEFTSQPLQNYIFPRPSTSSNIYFDDRCRKLILALDEAMECSDRFIDCSLLHEVQHRYPVQVLCVELDRELDRVITDEILDKEKANSLFRTCPSSPNAIPLGPRYLGRRKKGRDAGRRCLSFLPEEGAMNLKRDIEIRKKLGFGGCIACLNNPCNWKPVVDNIEPLQERKEVLTNELFLISKKHDKVLTSKVPASVMRGGEERFHRQDLIYVLRLECREIDLQISLTEVDKELHDAIASCEPYIEVSSLHGYNTLMNTYEAREALEREHSHLVALSVSGDIVNDILNLMLEGWHFGEYEVPYIKVAKNVGSERNKVPLCERLKPIFHKSSRRCAEKSSRKREKIRLQKIGSLENTMRYSLFCITLMYFRALYLVQREKKSYSDASRGHIFCNNSVVELSNERRQMVRESNFALERQRKARIADSRAKVGAERKAALLRKEKYLAAKLLNSNRILEREHKASARIIQRYYRGFLGREKAKCNAIEREKEEQWRKLANRSATCIERIYRGHIGRRIAISARKEMIEFIAQVRKDEALQEVEDYMARNSFISWKTKLFRLRKKT